VSWGTAVASLGYTWAAVEGLVSKEPRINEINNIFNNIND
jgi:hypothetical protein